MGCKEIYHEDDKDFLEIIFLYTLSRGVVNNLYGLNVANMAGVPKELLLKASALSKQKKLEIELNDYVKFAQMVQKFLKDELDIDTLFNYLR